MLEKILESPLNSKEIKPVNPKGNQLWIFIGRTDAEAEAPILWPCDSKSQLTEKDPDAGKDWRQEEKGTTVDEMVGWYHPLNEHEFEQTSGAGEVQGSLACCSPWVTKSWTWLSDCTTINKELLYSRGFYSIISNDLYGKRLKKEGRYIYIDIDIDIDI